MPQMHVRRTRRMTINPREAAALHRLLDAYLASEHPEDPGMPELLAFESRLAHAQMDHSAYEKEGSP